jgi:hypothetical protein
MLHSQYVPAFVVASLMLFASASVKAADIVETAVGAGNFKTLAAALGAADLVDTLKGAGPFTVFAPTDEAFAKLPKGTVESLLKPENKDKLKAILLIHVVPGSVMAADVVKLKDAKTAALRASLGKIGLVNALVIGGPEVDGNFRLAARNIPNVDVLPNAGLNVYDVLRRRTLVLTKDAVEAINARFAEKEAA